MEKEIKRLKTSSALDKLLNGGIECSAVSNVYGPPGSGKTNLCLLATVACAKKGEKVLYVDTEGGFSVERLRQIGEVDLSKIMVLEPKTFEEQGKLIRKLPDMMKEENIGLVVVDSIVALYRLKMGPDNYLDLSKELANQLALLSKISREREIPVLITNQIYSDIDTGKVELSGSSVVKWWSKCLLELKKVDNARRLAIVRKHRSIPEGKELEFEIVEKGIKAGNFRLF